MEHNRILNENHERRVSLHLALYSFIFLYGNNNNKYRSNSMDFAGLIYSIKNFNENLDILKAC